MVQKAIQSLLERAPTYHIEGERLHMLGVGAAPVPFRTLSAAQLAEAITAACQPTRQQRAAEVGARARAEDGVRTALTWIERVTGVAT